MVIEESQVTEDSLNRRVATSTDLAAAECRLGARLYFVGFVVVLAVVVLRHIVQ